jgi:glycosyltransferase involved in cell wall biosynthesis
MLGWEFPPVINGGLGVACHDLCQALTQHAKITMIIPQNSSKYKMENCELVGLNDVPFSILSSFQNAYDERLFEEVNYIPYSLNPYYSEEIIQNKIVIMPREKHYENIKDTGRPFEIKALYGHDLIEKVIQFGNIAAQYALTKNFDIIHAHDWMTLIAGMKIKALTGKPLVVHIHSLEIDRGGENSKGSVFELERKGMEAADVIIPVSEFTGQIIQKHYGIPAEKIFPVHNGIRPVKSFRTQKPFNEKLVVFVGRLTRQKGPSRLVEIASKVMQHTNDVRFAIAGKGDRTEEMIRLTSENRIGNKFHITGFQTSEKIRQLLSMADAYCMPSVSEPFGLSAVEAVQFGVPCIISKQSGVAEVLRGAMKFDHWDTDRAADFIINVLHNDILKKKVVQDAYHDLENISWDLSAEKVMQVYSNNNLC